MSRLIQQLRDTISETVSDERGSVGIFCPYSVEELIDASGYRPVRLTPGSSELSRADGYLPSNFCSYLRHITDRALKGELKGIEAIVFSHSCDGARRTFDVFDQYIGDIPVQFIDVPKSSDEVSISYFREQLVLLKTFLEKLSGEDISEDSIKHSIERYSRNRALLRKVYRLNPHQNILSASDFMSLLELNMAVPKEQANAILEQVCTEYETAHSAHQSREKRERVRVFISGNMFDSLPLLDFIEECGGAIVGDDFCFGGRYGQLEMTEEDDPLTMLAKGYLGKVPCGRMQNNRDRFEYILQEMERSNAQGVIYTSLKFCDHFLVDYPVLKKLLDARGIPSLFLEGEYYSFASGQVKTRVEAFLEML